MGTTTTNLGLRKPATTDAVNVTTDLSENWDKLDVLAGGVGMKLGYTSGRIIIPDQIGATTATATDGVLMSSPPFSVRKACALDRLYCDVTTVGASSTIRLGVYSLGSDGIPLTKVADAVEAGATAIDSAVGTGLKTQTLAANISLSPGVDYCFVLVAQGGSPVVRACRAHGFGTITATPADLSDPFLTTGYRQASVSAAMPTTFAAGAFGACVMMAGRLV